MCKPGARGSSDGVSGSHFHMCASTYDWIFYLVNIFYSEQFHIVLWKNILKTDIKIIDWLVSGCADAHLLAVGCALNPSPGFGVYAWDVLEM